MPSPEFELAVAKVKTLTKSPSNENLLELYALFKQATVGDNNTEMPGVFNLVGKAKWDAWTSKSGMSSEEAEKEYIALVARLAA
jgi:diazepam-binding inhibitor (GABA receptor modulating acyl-CoA-binding protein)